MLYKSDAKRLADKYFEMKEKTKETLDVISDCIKDSASQGFYSNTYFVDPSILTDSEVDFLAKELRSYGYDVKVFTDGFGYQIGIKWD